MEFESHTSTVAWGEFCSTVEDVVVLTGFVIFGESKTIKLPENVVEVVLGEVGNREALNKGLSDSKSFKEHIHLVGEILHSWHRGRERY